MCSVEEIALSKLMEDIDKLPNFCHPQDFINFPIVSHNDEKKEVEKWFDDKYPLFFKKFGMLMYDFCNGCRLSYHCKTLEEKGEHCCFDVSFLTEEEVDKLLEKSEKDNIDYLYKAVKDHPYYIDPDVLY